MSAESTTDASIAAAQGLTIEDFRGDFEPLSSMMEAAWAQSRTTPFSYTPEYLRSVFEYPGAVYSLAPTIYDGAKPVAFAAGFPRRVHVDGRKHAILLISLLTAAVEYHSRGYGIVVWSELVRRAQAAGFDGMVNYCVEGEAMDRMILGSCRRLKLPVQRIYSVRFLSKVLTATTVVIGDSEEPGADELVEVAAQATEPTGLARQWSPEEALWQITRRDGVVAARRADGLPGLLNGYVMEMANARRSKCVIVDDVLWGDLGAEDRHLLAQDFVNRGVAAGAQIVVVPSQGYADLSPFQAIGFRESNRIVHAYLTLWNDAEIPASVDSFYLDVN